MSRITLLNIVLAALVVALISVLVVLETTDDSAATTTTTTSTTTTTTTTTTTLPPTTTSSSTTSSTSSTTSTSTTTTEPAPLFPRSAYRLLVVNGSSAGSRLQPTIDLIRLSGYEQLRGTAGAVLTTETSIYYLDERFRGAAERLADDLGIPDERVEPFIAAPPIAARGDAQLVVYLGGS